MAILSLAELCLVREISSLAIRMLVYLRALIHLLIGKKLLSGDEVAEMVRVIERSAEPDARPEPAADTSSDLLALRQAVEQAGDLTGGAR